MTIGIVLYEMRNTVLYDAAIHRAKWLEVSLNLPILTYGKEKGGLFSDRPPSPKLFEGSWLFNKSFWLRQVRKFDAYLEGSTTPRGEKSNKEESGVEVWHDRALAFVYSASLGGWVYIIANSLLTLLSQQPSEVNAVTSLLSVLAAVIVAFLFVREWYRFDKRTDKPKPREGIW